MLVRARAAAVTLAVALSSLPAAADDLPAAVEEAATPPPTAAAETHPAGPSLDSKAAPVIIRSITIQVVDVFDTTQPGEDRLFHRVVDTLHIQTRDRTIRRELLFREGDVVDRELLAESERNLRTLGYIRRAEITTRPNEDGTADVIVRVQDSWTTRVSYRLSRTGGNTRNMLAAQEEDLLGLGKTLAFSWQSNQDRSKNTFSYQDHALFGSRARLDVAHSEASDGSGDFFALQRPFFSFDTPWAAGSETHRLTQSDGVFLDGEKLVDFSITDREAGAWYALSRPVSSSLVRRWTFGWRVSRQNTIEASCLSPLAEAGYACDHKGKGADKEDLPPEFLLPTDRTTSALTIGFTSEGRSWIKLRNVVRIERSEDFNLGRRFSVTSGISLRAVGASADELLIGSAYDDGITTGDHSFLLLHAGLDSRIGSGSDAANTLSFAGTWYETRFHHQTLAARLTADIAENLDAPSLLQIGGDEGLRGFKSRVATGDRRFLATFEDRVWLRRELFRLIYFGAAVFADVGNAWGGPLKPDYGTTFSDIGIGLRFDASRAAHGGLLRLDFAAPVTGDKFGGPGVQFSFSHGWGW